MGMYTEFIFGAEISRNTPKICIDAIDYVINGEVKQSKFANPKTYEEIRFNENYFERTTSDEDIQKFIDEYSLYQLFCSCSYYFGAANPVNRFHYDHISGNYHISTRADLRNGGCIEKFIEYITPYVVSGSGYEHQIFAYVQYEESEFPTLYGIDGKYDYTDPLLEGKYQKSLVKMESIFNSFVREYMGEVSFTKELFEKYGLDYKEATKYDCITILIGELKDKMGKTLDQNYKALQELFIKLNQDYNTLKGKLAIAETKLKRLEKNEVQ